MQKIGIIFILINTLFRPITIIASGMAMPPILTSNWQLEEIADEYSQDSTFLLLHQIPVKSTCFTMDYLQNIYIATEEGQLLKYNNKGVKEFEYNNKRLGQATKIDASNPLNILVYYPDFEQIIILDRTLSEIKSINLLDLEIIEPAAVAMANDNNIWVYDQVAAVLKKVNQHNRVLFASRNLNQLTRKNLNPTHLQEQNNLLFLSDPQNGFFVFDTFGQLKQSFPILGMDGFQVQDQQIIYWQANQLFSFYLDAAKAVEIATPVEKTLIEAMNINGGFLLIAKEKEVEVYKG
jgi:hypothetical protein